MVQVKTAILLSQPIQKKDKVSYCGILISDRKRLYHHATSILQGRSVLTSVGSSQDSNPTITTRSEILLLRHLGFRSEKTWPSCYKYPAREECTNKHGFKSRQQPYYHNPFRKAPKFHCPTTKQLSRPLWRYWDFTRQRCYWNLSRSDFFTPSYVFQEIHANSIQVQKRVSYYGILISDRKRLHHHATSILQGRSVLTSMGQVKTATLLSQPVQKSPTEAWFKPKALLAHLAQTFKSFTKRLLVLLKTKYI
jgi:hypothetical protein